MEGDRGSAESYFRAILDNIPAGIIFFDKNGKIIYKNKKVGEIVGSPENIAKESGCSKELKNLISKGMQFRNAMWEKNGRFFSVDGIPMQDGSIIIMNDVSEKIYAENALKENERKYRILTESSPAGIVILNGNSCIFANKKFREIVGYDSTDGKNITDFVHTGDVALIRKKIDEAMEGKDTPSCTIRLVDKNGKVAWTEINLSLVNYEGKKEVILNIADITKKKMMEEELDLSNKKMKEIIEREQRFIEDISHYFFNPLCIAKGYIDLSLKEATPELKRKLEITRTAVDRVETVVKHVVMEGKIYE